MSAVTDLYAAYSTLVLFAGVAALLALSIYVTLMAGQLSLGNAALATIGGYTAAILTKTYHTALWPALLAGAALATVVAAVIGIPCLRLRGIYLAIATLAFGEVVRVAALNLTITGGALGLVGIAPLVSFPHVYGALAAAAFFFYRLERSRTGRAFAAIREDEAAAQAMGIRVMTYKVLAFSIAGFLAGLAGGLAVHFTYLINPTQASFGEAVTILTYAIFGGTGSFAGPILGGMALTVLPEALRFLKEYRLLLDGAILVLVTTYLPNGVLDPVFAGRLGPLLRWRRPSEGLAGEMRRRRRA
ncbi:MAG TPA: branched-chain amino acid ABC transporter permease [bacterium]|nr:branched-chain amino acid ABC transporter permease [bacterium]